MLFFVQELSAIIAPNLVLFIIGVHLSHVRASVRFLFSLSLATSAANIPFGQTYELNSFWHWHSYLKFADELD